MAKLSLTFDELDKLPVGASFQAKDGNATGTVTKDENNTLEFTANCDSLLIVVESLVKEVYRYHQENAELKTQLKEQKIVEVNKLSGWQHFQIYAFRFMAAAYIIYLLIKKFKSKIIKL